MTEGRSVSSMLREFTEGGGSIPRVWGRRAFWQVKLRWAVPPAIALAVLIGRWIGFDFPTRPVYGVAACIFLYNILFARLFSRSRLDLERERLRDRFYTILQVTLDYAAMFVLIYFTGGACSPLVYFFIFHVVIAGIQFRPSTAYIFAVIASAGLWLLLFLEVEGILPCHAITFRGQVPPLMESPAHIMVGLGFFTVTIFIVATATTQIMNRLRARVTDLAQTTNRMVLLNEHLNSLYAMLRAVGREQRLKPILRTVTAELASTLVVRVVAVKLLSEDGETLRFVAAHGLPQDFVEKKVVQLAQSPLNRQVINGETFVHGHLGDAGEYELPEEMVKLGIESVVFAPLVVEGRVIGILGAYCDKPERFSADDSSFFALAAELIAVAIENARGYEEIRALMKDRAKFMLQVAHNMRAPINASLSMLELIRGEYFGQITSHQQEILQRVERRLIALNRAIGELLAIGKARDRSVEITDVRVDLNQLARQVEETFREEAEQKKLCFRVEAPSGLPAVDSGADLLLQVVENLVSNAIKYTPEGGKVDLKFGPAADGEVRVVVGDTGIGIPVSEQEQIGTEFFRASNAKELEAEGTGLGLAFVMQAVKRHRGRFAIESKEGKGTIIVIELPVRQND